MRKSLAQRGGRGQSVNDVSHRAEPHNEQAVESGCVDRHDFRGPSRERIISVAE